MKNVAGTGVRWLDVAPARFPGWIAGFAGRHAGGHGTGTPGPAPAAGSPPAISVLTVTLAGDAVTFTAPDGAVAECHPPFPPVPGLGAAPPGTVGATDGAAAVAQAIAAHALSERTVGVLLVRLGGYAAGVFTGSPPRLADAKTGSRPVHGRSAAGGRSQHRFARRREKQASEALQAAANAAAEVFGRWAGPDERRDRSEKLITARGGDAEAARRPQLDAIVLGGDKRAVAALGEDSRLAPYLAIATDRFLTVPDPRRRVLEEAPRLFLAVRIWLTEPAT